MLRLCVYIRACTFVRARFFCDCACTFVRAYFCARVRARAYVGARACAYVRARACTCMLASTCGVHAKTDVWCEHGRVGAWAHGRVGAWARAYVRACVRICVHAYVHSCVRACGDAFMSGMRAYKRDNGSPARPNHDRQAHTSRGRRRRQARASTGAPPQLAPRARQSVCVRKRSRVRGWHKGTRVTCKKRMPPEKGSKLPLLARLLRRVSRALYSLSGLRASAKRWT